MTFFESVLVLLLLSIGLLQVSRRLKLPYPAMLAAAGSLVVLIPGSPSIVIDPSTALALFIAPALLDAAFDFPVTLAQRFWQPLVALAVVAVLLTTIVVAWIGWRFAGLPFAAAVVLGAIVAPPDAAAATAVLSVVSVPKNTASIIKGESLFNDAMALLLFGGALAVQEHGGLDAIVGARLLIAAPAGALLGYVFARLLRFVQPIVTGSLGGNLLQFVSTCLVWVVADRLSVSAVLCVVTYAMTLARSSGVGFGPRMRVHSYAVWATVVFLLNVLAFLFMGMQARSILSRMESTSLKDAVRFALLVIIAVIVVRFIIVMTSNRLAARFESYRGRSEPPLVRQGVLLGWCGMRGLVTLATAFALPSDFPKRDLVTLTAFSVVMATLVIQGLTLAPLIHLLKLDRSEDTTRELAFARHSLVKAGLAHLVGQSSPEADLLRASYTIRLDEPARQMALEQHRELGLSAIAAERKKLEVMRLRHEVDSAVYDILLEELDWRELCMLPDSHRRIDEN
ncbi:cation:proton antiporter [Lichenicoccus roseus]|uniref:Sodium:proton antiporter n=1 Tax=Lichenicoccus roseus TaxID=2683649 RepID=A0A5R9J961_9PROT|nr:sodium:proton antiporter [Lichenicoccus roseus]TLU71906.1 sodium:proton antiporter [Lichenicoccus roseus]